jgi:hypothetical protein
MALQESLYRFWPGCRPPYRQMFYQLCDVDLPEVQAIVHQNDGQVLLTVVPSSTTVLLKIAAYLKEYHIS